MWLEWDWLPIEFLRLSSLRIMLFLVPHFFLVLSICELYMTSFGVVYCKDTPVPRYSGGLQWVHTTVPADVELEA